MLSPGLADAPVTAPALMAGQRGGSLDEAFTPPTVCPPPRGWQRRRRLPARAYQRPVGPVRAGGEGLLDDAGGPRRGGLERLERAERPSRGSVVAVEDEEDLAPHQEGHRHRLAHLAAAEQSDQGEVHPRRLERPGVARAAFDRGAEDRRLAQREGPSGAPLRPRSGRRAGALRTRPPPGRCRLHGEDHRAGQDLGGEAQQRQDRLADVVRGVGTGRGGRRPATGAGGGRAGCVGGGGDARGRPGRAPSSPASGALGRDAAREDEVAEVHLYAGLARAPDGSKRKNPLFQARSPPTSSSMRRRTTAWSVPSARRPIRRGRRRAAGSPSRRAAVRGRSSGPSR